MCDGIRRGLTAGQEAIDQRRAFKNNVLGDVWRDDSPTDSPSGPITTLVPLVRNETQIDQHQADGADLTKEVSLLKMGHKNHHHQVHRPEVTIDILLVNNGRQTSPIQGSRS